MFSELKKKLTLWFRSSLRIFFITHVWSTISSFPFLKIPKRHLCPGSSIFQNISNFLKILFFSLEEVFYQFWIRTKVIFLRRSDQQTEKIISKQSQSLEKKRIWGNKKYHYGAHVLWFLIAKMQRKKYPEKIEKKIERKNGEEIIFEWTFDIFWKYFPNEKFRQWRIAFGWSRRVTIT